MPAKSLLCVGERNTNDVVGLGRRASVLMSKAEPLPLTGPQAAGRLKGLRPRQLLLALIIGFGIVAGGVLLGVSQYAGSRGALIAASEAGAARFEAVFREASMARQQALRLGAEVLARDELVANALRLRDRADLARRTVPLFEQVLRPRFGATVLDFPDAEGVMFFRAHRPGQFGDDANDRAMVTTAIKARTAISGLEIGRSGPELRAMTPMMAGEVLIGAVEIGSSLDSPLTTAARAAGLEFAFAVDRAQVPTTDETAAAALFAKANLLYLKASRPDLGEILPDLPFDPMATGSQVVRRDGREVFVQTLPVEDVSRRPVTRVTLVRDLTEPLRARRTTVLLYTAGGTCLVLALVLVGLFQFQSLRGRLERGFAGRLQELRDKASAYDRLSGTLGDVQAWKLGFVNELTIRIKEPLTALRGSLDYALREPRGVNDALRPALDDVRRLDEAVSDQISMMSVRDGLLRFDAEDIDITALVDAVVARESAAFPVTVAAADPLRVTCAASLLAASLRAILGAIHRGSDARAAVVSLALVGERVVVRVSGEGRWRGQPPTLDEAAAFVGALAPGRDGSLVLAKLMIERFGGEVRRLDGANVVGFELVLPEASS